MNHWRVVTALAFLKLGSVCAAVSSVGPGYTAGYGDQKVYSIDFQTGANFVVTTIPGSNPADIALLNKNTAYVLGAADGNIYSINLQNNTYSKVTPTPLPVGNTLFDLALASDRTAYVTSQSDSTIYSVDLKTGAYSAVATIPGNPNITDIAMLNRTTAYTVGASDNNIYFVDLESGLSSFVANIPGNPVLEGIALSTSTTAYVVGDNDGTVRVVDLKTGVSSIVTTISGPALLANAAINDTTLYTVDYGSSDVYVVNLLNGQSSALASFGALLNGMAILLQMPTSGLHGNNTKLATYLNHNGTIDLIRSFALLPSGLAQALESVAPTRNTFATFASQIAQIGMSRLVDDHQRQNRWKQKNTSSPPFAYNHLTASLDKAIPSTGKPISPTNDSLWLGAFGEYAHEKAQHQTPAFGASTCGAVLAWDFLGTFPPLLGIGAAYAYTHLHEENGFGTANVQQGDLFFYGTFPISKWYFDAAVWGGYYHIHNRRNIVFSDVDMTASLSTHGWQCTPHLEIGYKHSFQSFGMEPFTMVDWVNCWERRATETGAPAFNMHQKGRYSSLLRIESGIRFEEVRAFECWTMTWMQKLSYAYQKTFHTGTINAFLVGSPNSFTVSTLTGAQNLGVAEVEVLFDPKNAAYPYASLSGHVELGQKYQSYQGMIEFGKKF